ncbi:helix-turn-helix transcriptional regulator [Yinghuangia seranimata]|uniref:helix-turn-helix transcriptional regulator n=1 Tax=Yinghuangia seranimata TaxID=408067 RepID=UPI00248BFA8B|nr:helix-turn-helix domain-containing protein [Yinghuangia seranimata]MDI2125395.1 helix-turn-helix domain-containing protein [Yinghuangia seranimata]
MSESVETTTARWTFLTNHARVLAMVARDPLIRVRDIAASCLLTERTVGAILADLEAAGYLRRSKVGRRNAYTVVPEGPLRHPADGGRPVAEILGVAAAGMEERDGRGEHPSR